MFLVIPYLFLWVQIHTVHCDCVFNKIYSLWVVYVYFQSTENCIIIIEFSFYTSLSLPLRRLAGQRFAVSCYTTFPFVRFLLFAQIVPLINW